MRQELSKQQRQRAAVDSDNDDDDRLRRRSERESIDALRNRARTSELVVVVCARVSLLVKNARVCVRT